LDILDFVSEEFLENFERSLGSSLDSLMIIIVPELLKYTKKILSGAPLIPKFLQNRLPCIMGKSQNIMKFDLVVHYPS